MLSPTRLLILTLALALLLGSSCVSTPTRVAGVFVPLLDPVEAPTFERPTFWSMDTEKPLPVNVRGLGAGVFLDAASARMLDRNITRFREEIASLRAQVDYYREAVLAVRGSPLESGE